MHLCAYARPLARPDGPFVIAGFVPLLTAGVAALMIFGGSPGGAAAQSDIPAGTKIVLVTGSTSGLGREVARAMAADGAHVIVHGRNQERADSLVEEIRAAGVGSARFYAADFASFDEVRAFAQAILRDYPRIDLLVNNAGVWLEGNERQLSQDGHELHFQVNYLSHFLLTHMLLPRLRVAASARIINVSSAAQQPIDFDDVMLSSGYSAGRGYAQSKLAQVMFTIDLAEELAGTGIIVAALHPATMMDTNMVLSRGARVRSSVDEGTEAVMRLITEPDIESGSYSRGTSPASANEQAYDAEARAQLRALSVRLTGVGWGGGGGTALTRRRGDAVGGGPVRMACVQPGTRRELRDGGSTHPFYSKHGG